MTRAIKVTETKTKTKIKLNRNKKNNKKLKTKTEEIFTQLFTQHSTFKLLSLYFIVMPDAN